MRSRIPVVLAALLLGAPCCTQAPARPNFLLLSIDTLRADHLGSYGYGRPTSPNLDRFASRSIRYANALAPTPWTLPSHVAMLTGRDPHELGILDYQSSIPPGVTSLAELLATTGYQTAAFVDSSPKGLLGAGRGFSRGFEVYRHAPHDPTARYRYDMASTVDVGLRWLELRDPGRPFFLFLHTKSVHTAPDDPKLRAEGDAPYKKPQPFGTRFLPSHRTRYEWREKGVGAGVILLRELNRRIGDGTFDRGTFPEGRLQELIALYDGGIFYVDLQFARLLTGIEELDLEGNTVVIVTADHGEAFLDHLFFLHKELYDPLLRVPLFVHDPDGPQGRVVTQRVALVDLAPSVLRRARIPAPASLNGLPLPVDDDPVLPSRPFFSYFQLGDGYYYTAFSMRDGPWKLIYHRLASWPDHRLELYDTRTDPGERRPIHGRTERSEEMLGRLVEWIETAPQDGAHRIELDRDSAEQLRALGYLE